MKILSMKLAGSYLLLSFSCNCIYSQMPGAVGANLTYWIKANATAGKMTVGAGNRVSSWTNEKSTFAVTQATASKMPVLTNSTSSTPYFNYNPFLNFVTASSQSLVNAATSPDLAGTAPTIFIVANTDASANSALTYYANTNYRYQMKPNYRVQSSVSSSTGYASDFTYAGPKPDVNITMLANNGAALNSRINGTSFGLSYNTVATRPTISAGLCIGTNLNNAEYFGAGIAEAVIYNTVLSAANIRQVESYLAIKYGITLNSAGLNNPTTGYVNSLGDNIYSTGTDGINYWNQIIGIMRDSLSGGSALYQRQSHQPDDSTRIYLGMLQAGNAANTSVFTNNISSVVIGNNTGRLCASGPNVAQHPATAAIRLDREWKVQITGATPSTNVPDNFNMDVTLSSCASGSSTWGGLGNLSTLGLLVNNTSDLTTGQYFPNFSTYNGNTMTLSLNRVAGVITVQNLNTALMAYLGSTVLNAVNTPLYFTIAALDGSVLPARLLSFEANTFNNLSVNLQWDIASEGNVQSCSIQRSADGISWTDVATVLPAGSAGNIAHYAEEDPMPITGISYYRIRMADGAGLISYSQSKKMIIGGRGFTINAVTPNPFNAAISVDIYLLSPNKITASLIDAYGRVVSNVIVNGNSGHNTVCISNLHNITAGVYILKVEYNKQSLVKRVLKTP